MTPLQLADAVAGTLIVVGSVSVLLAAVAMIRVRDAIMRVNVLSPVTAFGVPLIVLGEYVSTSAHNGATLWGLMRLFITLVALLVVSSLASNALARAAVLSGARIDPATSPNDLAEEPRHTR
ncbi:monovalent cation/H(+) antiporter subunit G [Mobilicoccus sp.]|uniref:monovalent cation/H(+) antiporter subunit G n=1 Tax=Mobilicoccus sp. TaxID=2034349 RepID=UPI00289FF037|nr:monovalent cation/H(+) antiporter subunit G [Mobilicoccus sp.]